MNTTISNNGLPKLPQPAAGQGNGPGQGTAIGGGDAVDSTASSDDQVRLTDSARALQDAARTGDAAAIDSKRVEKIRAALADGSYRIDPAGIADRMLALDAQIGGTTVPDKA